jgi:NAD(P)-dependent dehydrogenase (short-subunit alcohol dehydrogenase family)
LALGASFDDAACAEVRINCGTWRELMRLKDKVALISGGGSGIGAATARRFAREGAKVVLTGRRPEPIAAVAASVGGLSVAGDTSNPAHTAKAVETAVTTFGRLDIVVASAGLGFLGSAGDIHDDQWYATINANLTGAMVLVRAALPSMLSGGGGAIVFVSSVSGLVSAPSLVAYETSKAGLIALSRSIAVEYGPRGVRSNVLCPGWVVTPMGDEAMDGLAAARGTTRENAYGLVTSQVPLRRPATADEMGACCLFLASDDASIVTGSVLVADGGGLAVDLTGMAMHMPTI